PLLDVGLIRGLRLLQPSSGVGQRLFTLGILFGLLLRRLGVLAGDLCFALRAVLRQPVRLLLFFSALPGLDLRGLPLLLLRVLFGLCLRPLLRRLLLSGFLQRSGFFLVVNLGGGRLWLWGRSRRLRRRRRALGRCWCRGRLRRRRRRRGL